MIFEINSRQKSFHFWYINQAPSTAAKTAINIIKDEQIDFDACRYCRDERQSCFRKKSDRRCVFCAAKGRTNETCMLNRKMKKTAEKKIIVNTAFFEKRSIVEKIYSFEKSKTAKKIKIFEKNRKSEKFKKSEKSHLFEKKSLLKKPVHDVVFFRLA